MEKVDREYITELLKKLRKENNISQDELASHLNVSVRTIRRWEKGLSLPSIEDVVSICKFYNIDINDIYDADHENKKESILENKTDIYKKISFTENSITDINSEINDIKIAVEAINSWIVNRFDDYKWLYLFGIHFMATTCSFFHFTIGIIGLLPVYIVSVIYCFLVEYVQIKYRRNTRLQVQLLVYAIVLFINLLLNYVYYADVSPNNIVHNIYIAIFNGPIYGLLYVCHNSFSRLVALISGVYFLWVLISIFNIHKQRKEGKR